MSDRMWFYFKNEQQCGPVSRDEIARLLTAGDLTTDTMVWSEGMEHWKPIRQIPDLASVGSTGQIGQRPRCVTVLGILNIIFGGMSLLCSPLGVIALLAPQPNTQFEFSEGFRIFSLVGYAVGFVFAIVLLASGIGLLNLKRWARQTAYAYAWAAICWALLSSVINAVLMLSVNVGDMPPEARAGFYGGMVGGMCGGMCIGLIYPIILLVYMRKPDVIEACSK